MTTQTSTTSFPSRRRRLAAAAAGIVLVAAGLTAVGSPARAAPAIPQNCTAVQYGPTAYVECVVTDSGAITFTDLVPGTITPRDGDPVILTARGGDGATLDKPGNFSGGPGGTARTIATAGDIDQLHLAIGQNADSVSRQGGSATVVSAVPIEDVTSIDDTYVVAGGGGAQGARLQCSYFGGFSQGAGSGGQGGFADANRNNGDTTGHGWNGGTGHLQWDICQPRDGHPGSGGDLGVGGTNPGDRRSDGADGVGGHGGVNGWQGGVAAGHEAGRGGITSVWAMGGGGWGGGAGGERNGGGGGGGSFARAATEHIDLPRNYASTPSVTIAWPAPYIG